VEPATRNKKDPRRNEKITMVAETVAAAQSFVNDFNEAYAAKHEAFEVQFWGNKMAPLPLTPSLNLPVSFPGPRKKWKICSLMQTSYPEPRSTSRMWRVQREMKV
jgi:hypothetical protein